MPSVRCREPIETGLEAIDAQHRELYEALDRLAEALRPGAPATGLDEGLAFLSQHAIRHCQAEETLMKDMGFPDRIVHADQHQDLIRRMRDLQYRRTRGLAVGPEVVAVLEDWLDHHIRESDLAYAAHLRAQPAP